MQISARLYTFDMKIKMCSVLLDSVDEERDLEVTVQHSLKVDKQCAKAVKSANSVLGMTRRSFVN